MKVSLHFLFVCSSEAESMLRGFEISVGDDVLQVADEDCTSQVIKSYIIH